jgi:hypothetical protein
MNDATSTNDAPPPGFWGSRYALGLIVLGGVATYLLLSEHRAHFLGALPLLLLLACPLMHVFMHSGHGGHGRGHAGHHGGSGGDDAPSAQPAPKTGAQP